MYSKHLKQVVRQINLELAQQSTMHVGATVQHPDGRMVQITGGCYLDPKYGRVSNRWTWREVLPSGQLGKEESGYGW